VCSRNRRATVDVFIDGRSGSIGQRSRGGVAGKRDGRGRRGWRSSRRTVPPRTGDV